MKRLNPVYCLGDDFKPVYSLYNQDFYQLHLDSRIHDTSSLAYAAIVYKNVVIWAYTTICDRVILRDNVMIGGRCYVGADTIIGEGTRIQDGCHITDRMVIGRNCFFGPCVVTMNDRHPVVNNPNYVAEPPVIGDNVTIGAGSVIYPGVKIGSNSTVAAGAVVTRDVPENSIVMIKDRLMVTSKE